MGLIVDYAQQILAKAILLEYQLENAGAPQPSWESGAPSSFPPEAKYPDIFETRQSIIDASKQVTSLALGPSETILSWTGPQRMMTYALRTIEHYDVANVVPKGGSMTFTDLAKKLEVNQEVLERIMRLAFGFHLFEEKPLGSVSHTALSEALPVLSGWNKMTMTTDNALSLQAWPAALKVYNEDAGAINLPWNIGLKDDRPHFAYIQSGDGETGGMKGFTAAMESRARTSGGSDFSFFRDGFDWESLAEGPLIELGGGSGQVVSQIAKHFPKLNVVIQDLPENKPIAERKIASSGLGERLKFQAQDFFTPQPEGLNPKAYFFKSVLHDWNDADCAKILKSLIPGVEKGAKIFCMDRVAYLPAEGKVATHKESLAQFLDLMMWSNLGAKERNVEQWKKVAEMTDSRLKVLAYRTPTGCDWGMLELGFEESAPAVEAAQAVEITAPEVETSLPIVEAAVPSVEIVVPAEAAPLQTATVAVQA